ncbi:MAG TPA: proton-conducting transporter membrane subunit, partial [Gemmatimonadaceae bacterium]|nr:proton-conducting transporter membrane subunit [Gemmatimonadaceae bacterium]
MTLLIAGLVLIVMGGLSHALLRRGGVAVSARDFIYQTFLISGCAIGVAAAVLALVTGTPVATTTFGSMPGGGWALGIDALSAVFLVAVLGVGAMCAIFGVHDVLEDAAHSRRSSPLFFALTLAALAAVVAARTVFTFLTAWEIMAIGSYLLIVTHHEDADVRRAGLVYLVATHTATLALFAMFATWQGYAVSGDFASLAGAAESLSSGATTAILLLALVGFGFKAGLVPLHFWLPPAHASAPSDV